MPLVEDAHGRAPDVRTTALLATVDRRAGLARGRIDLRHLRNAAQTLEVELPALLALESIESSRSGFDGAGRPKLRFEAHLFRRFTKGRFDASHPTLSAPYPGSLRLSSSDSDREWRRFETASGLNESAAIRAASWGRYQILGKHYELLGFDSPQGFRETMEQSELAQLDLLILFLRNQPDCLGGMQTRDWRRLALCYNGRDYERNGYHLKLERAYDRFKKRLEPKTPPKPPDPDEDEDKSDEGDTDIVNPLP